MTSGTVGGSPKYLFLSDKERKLLQDLAGWDSRAQEMRARYEALIKKPVVELRQKDVDELESLVEHIRRRETSFIHGCD